MSFDSFSPAEARTSVALSGASDVRKKRISPLAAVIAVVVLIAVLGGIWGIHLRSMMAGGFQPPPETVATVSVESTQWQGSRAAIGSLVALRGVTLSAEITGRVREILFESGSAVKKGAVLVRLDVSTEQAQLESAKADASLSKLTLSRARHLRQGNVNTQADLENAEAHATQGEAAVAALQATLAKKTIVAPFDGRIGIRQIELGQIVSSGNPIASLQTVTPIYAEFSLPQQAVAELKLGQKVDVLTDTYPGSKWQGAVTIINPEVDIATRNVRVRATLENPDGRLTPGMYVAVDVLSDEQRPVTSIPATSVIFAPYGDSVYVVEANKEAGKSGLLAKQRFVRLGERRGDFVAVVSGLSAGEQVVSGGAFKLRNGVSVVVNNALATPAELSPKPSDK